MRQSALDPELHISVENGHFSCATATYVDFPLIRTTKFLDHT